MNAAAGRRRTARPDARLPQPQLRDARRSRASPSIDACATGSTPRSCSRSTSSGSSSAARIRRRSIDDLGDRVVSLHVKDGVTLPSAAERRAVRERRGRRGRHRRAVRGRRREPAPGHRVAHRRVRPRRRAAGRGGPGQLRLPDEQRAGPRIASVTAASPGPRRDRRLRQRHRPVPARLRDRFPMIELAACADLDAGRAAALSAKGGFPAVPIDGAPCRPDHRDRPEPDPADRARRRVAGGDRRRQARLLREAARDDARGRGGDPRRRARRRASAVGGAPDTFLGGGLQTARAVIDAGRDRASRSAPTPPSCTSARSAGTRTRPSSTAPAADRCSTSGRTTSRRWSSLLGPIVDGLGGRAAASATSGWSGRGRGPATTFVAEVPTHARRHLPRSSRGRSAGSARRSTSRPATLPHIEIHGTDGSLSLGDPNHFDGARPARAASTTTDWEPTCRSAFDGTRRARHRARRHDRRDPRGPPASRLRGARVPRARRAAGDRDGRRPPTRA